MRSDSNRQSKIESVITEYRKKGEFNSRQILISGKPAFKIEIDGKLYVLKMASTCPVDVDTIRLSEDLMREHRIYGHLLFLKDTK